MAATYTIPEPVASSRKTDTSSPDRQREDLTNNDPGRRTPSHRKSRDIEANECDHCPHRRLTARSIRSLAGGYANDGDDVLSDEHEATTGE